MRYPLSRTFLQSLDESTVPISDSYARFLCRKNDPFRIGLLTAMSTWLNDFPCRVPQRTHNADYTIQADKATVLLEIDTVTILIDPDVRLCFAENIPNLIVVTHAHYDHAGGIQTLHERFPLTPIAMTHLTWELLATQNPDITQVRAAVGITLIPDGRTQLCDGTVLKSFPAGHLLGAAMIHVERSGTKILISGDFALRTLAGGITGAWPDEDYDLALLDGTHLADTEWPLVSQQRNNDSILAACTLAVNNHAGDVIFCAQALGHAQEVLEILADGQMQGLYPQYVISAHGYAATVTAMYQSEIPVHSPLRYIAQNADRTKAQTRLIVTSTTDAQTLQSISPEATIVREGTDALMQADGRIYRLSTHASQRELLCTALAVSTHVVCFYQCSTALSSDAEFLQILTQSGRQYMFLS